PEVNLYRRLQITSVSRSSKPLDGRHVSRVGRRATTPPTGHSRIVDETSNPQPHVPEPGEPSVDAVLDEGTARITVEGELTAAARRPLVNSVTALLLEHAPLQRIEL